jgi:hypothetical protein
MQYNKISSSSFNTSQHTIYFGRVTVHSPLLGLHSFMPHAKTAELTSPLPFSLSNQKQ